MKFKVFSLKTCYQSLWSASRSLVADFNNNILKLLKNAKGHGNGASVVLNYDLWTVDLFYSTSILSKISRHDGTWAKLDFPAELELSSWPRPSLSVAKICFPRAAAYMLPLTEWVGGPTLFPSLRVRSAVMRLSDRASTGYSTTWRYYKPWQQGCRGRLLFLDHRSMHVFWPRRRHLAGPRLKFGYLAMASDRLA